MAHRPVTEGFDPGEHEQITAAAINDRGNELLVVKELE
jgi:hypothetical protein